MKRLTLIACFCLALSARAELVHENYEGLRPNGMGGAFLAVSDDNNVLWYNPAGLANIKGAHFDLLDANLGVDSMDTLSRVGGAFGEGNFSNLVRPNTEYIQAGLRTGLFLPYFAVQFFDNLHSFFDLQNLSPTGGTVDVDSFNDIGVAMGAAIPMGPYVSVGATLRAFEHIGVDVDETGPQLLSSLNAIPTDVTSAVYTELQKLAASGWGLGVDLGTMVKLPTPRDYPTIRLAAVMEDVGETTFHALGTSSAPPPIPTTYHFGTSIKYDLPHNSYFLMAMDVRHAFEDLPFVKTFHVGAEYQFFPFSFRLGLYEGYPSAGFSLLFPPHTRVIFSTYEPELGDGLWQNGQRVYLLQLVIGFNPI
jgi:hypothetical protein